MAIMANGSGSGGGGGGGGGAGSSSTDSPFVIEHDDDSVLDNDYLEGGTIEADNPAHSNEPTTDRTPLTGNISSSSSSRPNITGSFLTSSIPGEDRRAPQNTIDETVWATLSRDLLAVWEKMRQVLWPKYLLGGMLARGGGIGAAERGEASGFGNGVGGGIRGLVGRWPDADVVLQGGMSEGLRDWDLWGPLIFCLLLSMFLSMRAQGDQVSLVFSGVFCIVWIGEAVVTMQIKLLGGNISFFQSVCIIGYTLFPLVIAALLSALGLPIVARIPVYLVLIAWSLAAGVSILGGSGVVKNRVLIAVYPLFVFYIGIGCLCFIS
ncbi:Yip1 domain-containing protein [Histoplasma ohiense]|nr:Yip1 domain-containing protein [Histoplasma ohiense (nom. inval.)]